MIDLSDNYRKRVLATSGRNGILATRRKQSFDKFQVKEAPSLSHNLAICSPRCAQRAARCSRRRGRVCCTTSCGNKTDLRSTRSIEAQNGFNILPAFKRPHIRTSFFSRLAAKFFYGGVFMLIHPRSNFCIHTRKMSCAMPI